MNCLVISNIAFLWANYIWITNGCAPVWTSLIFINTFLASCFYHHYQEKRFLLWDICSSIVSCSTIIIYQPLNVYYNIVWSIIVFLYVIGFMSYFNYYNIYKVVHSLFHLSYLLIPFGCDKV